MKTNLTQSNIDALNKVRTGLEAMNLTIHQGCTIDDNTLILSMMEALDVEFQRELIDGIRPPGCELIEFKTLSEFRAFAKSKNLRVRPMPATDVEDPADGHYFMGEDIYTFRKEGGHLNPGNGYFYDNGDESYGQFAEVQS